MFYRNSTLLRCSIPDKYRFYFEINVIGILQSRKTMDLRPMILFLIHVALQQLLLWGTRTGVSLSLHRLHLNSDLSKSSTVAYGYKSITVAFSRDTRDSLRGRGSDSWLDACPPFQSGPLKTPPTRRPFVKSRSAVVFKPGRGRTAFSGVRRLTCINSDLALSFVICFRKNQNRLSFFIFKLLVEYARWIYLFTAFKVKQDGWTDSWPVGRADEHDWLHKSICKLYVLKKITIFCRPPGNWFTPTKWGEGSRDFFILITMNLSVNFLIFTTALKQKSDPMVKDSIIMRNIPLLS